MFSLSPEKLLAAQILSALCIAPFLVFASWEWIAVMLLFYLLYAGVGVGLGFHRTLSHNSFKFHPLVKKLIIVIGTLANVGSPLTWVALHRAHHRHCDTPQDPHSPLHQSALFVLFLSMFATPSLKYVRDLLRDNFVLFLHKNYFLIQVPWILFLGLVGGWQAILACHVIPGSLTWLAGSFLNWFNHIYGYQTFDAGSSKNHWLTAVLVFGEGWHNNHHAKPTRATTRVSPHEFDLIYYLARAVGGKPTT